MRKVEKLILTILLIMLAPNVFSQKGKRDSLFAFREFASLANIYQHVPVQISVQIQNSATPFITPQDTLQSEMNVYFTGADFYVEAEGLEQIINDSLIIMVNNPAKQILIYRNDEPVTKKIQESVSMLLPDSSLQELAQKYQSVVQDLDGNTRRIGLSSRQTIDGIGKPKEIITATYQKASYKPIEISQTKLQLLPVDSAVYSNLINNKIYDGKLFSARTSTGQIFFLIKEFKTSYRFTKINYGIHNPPAKQQNRIAIAEDGSFVPAKGYEDYLVSREF